MRRAFWLSLLAALALFGALGTTAAGDATTPLVSATIYSSGGTSTESVSLAALQADPALCPPYTGPGLEEYPRPPQQPHTVYPTPDAPGQGTWALSTILQCLPTPVQPGAVTAISVVGSDGSPEVSNASQLTPADLTTPSDFQNPSEVPIILATGGAQYDRPWRGGSDYNFLDEVQEPGGTPITIQVFEGPQLHVSASASNKSPTTADTVTFAAAVSPPDENSPQYSWSFDGEAPPSDQESPRVKFPRAGTYNVSVRVTDSTGAVGSASVLVTVNKPTGKPPTHTGGNSHGGNGQHPGGGPTGPQGSHGNTPGGGGSQPQGGGHGGPGPGGKAGGNAPASARGSSRQPPTTPGHTPHSGTNGASGRAGTKAAGSGRASGGLNAGASGRATASIPSYPVPASALKTSARSSATAATHHAPPSVLRTPAARLPTGRPPVVSGHLIGDLVPLPLASSPYVHTFSTPRPTAQPVHEAVRTSALAAIGGALVFVLLLSLGAARELLAGRSWHRFRLGT